jgi:dTDP-4-amino-4,6-dideoxygalactose transaminase
MHIYHQFVIRAPRRDDLRAWLTTREIGTQVYYPVPLHLQECFRSLGGRPGMLPHAEAAARDVLALPIYAELNEAQQDEVVRTIADFYRTNG